MKLSHAFVEGGQTWAHRSRMMRQVFKMVLTISLSLGLAFFIYLLLNIEPVLAKSTLYHLKAKICLALGNKTTIDTSFWSQISHESHSSSTVLIDSQKVLNATLPYHRYFCFQLIKKLKTTLFLPSPVKSGLNFRNLLPVIRIRSVKELAKYFHEASLA